MHAYLQKRCEPREEARGIPHWTNRVSLIWVLWEGLLAGVIIKIPAAGCAVESSREVGGTLSLAEGTARAKTPRRARSVQGAGGMPIRLEHPERGED